MDVIRIEQLSKSHGPGFKLGPLGFNVRAGEVLGVVGPGGAGKTTLMKLIWGFSRPDHGSVRVFGLTPHLEQLNVRLRTGCLSSPQFYGCMKARRFLEFMAVFYDRWDAERVAGLSERFQIDLDKQVDELSRGERVKLGLISAVAHRPRLLLLDEPTLGLDAAARTDILEFIRELAREGVAIVVSSRDSDDLYPIANTVLMLDNGRHVCLGQLRLSAKNQIKKPRIARIARTDSVK